MPSQAKILVALFLCVISYSISGQKDLGISMIEEELEAMNLDFFTPTENKTKFLKPGKNKFFKYDTRIKVKSNEMEVLVAFHHDTITSPIATFYPHLEFNRLLNNVVPNDDDQEVLVIGWRDPKLRDKNADWGAEAYIRPRKEVSTYPYAKMISFYREGEGMVVMLYCFRNPQNVPELISFREQEVEQ